MIISLLKTKEKILKEKEHVTRRGTEIRIQHTSHLKLHKSIDLLKMLKEKENLSTEDTIPNQKYLSKLKNKLTFTKLFEEFTAIKPIKYV